MGSALVRRHRPHHEEGRALTNAVGNSVATLAIARWQGELGVDRLHTVLDRPEIVDRDVDAALRGVDTADEKTGRRRNSSTTRPPGSHVAGVGGDGERRG